MCYSTLGMNLLVVMLPGRLRVCLLLALYCAALYMAACVDASRTVFWDRSSRVLEKLHGLKDKHTIRKRLNAK